MIGSEYLQNRWHQDALWKEDKSIHAMFWTVFCSENVSPVTPVDVTKRLTTYLTYLTDQVHPFMEMVLFPNGSGLKGVWLYQTSTYPLYRLHT